MGKTYSLKLNDKEIKRVDHLLKKKNLTPSKLLRKALWQYIDEVNQKVNLISKNTVEKVNQVNHPIHIVKNYELLRHYKEEIDWLRNRIEYFEKLYNNLYEKSFLKLETKKKSLMSGIRM